MNRPARIEKGSGNVFADLGLPHPEQELLKAKLTLEIYRLIKKRDLTQAEAGKILGIKQPHVSALMRNRSGSFSVERLMDFLNVVRAERISTLRTEEYFRERSRRANRRKTLQILARAGRGNPPMEGDELPQESQKKPTRKATNVRDAAK